MRRTSSFFALAGSLGTLVCCFLPAVFVTLGLGATFAGLVSTFPQLIWISEHKPAVFSIAGALILIAFWLQWRSRNSACPIDPELARSCKGGKAWSQRALIIAALVFVCGATFAFVLPWLAVGA